MSSNADLEAVVPIIQTAKDLGLAIRSRRRELGWDQATLAKHVAVTRQWVIDIEKGKPRAELALAIRALRVLGLSLTVEAAPKDTAATHGPETGRRVGEGTPNLDIDSIVERNRGSAASRFAELSWSPRSKTAADYLREIDATGRRWASLTGSNAVKDAASALAEVTSASKLPRTAADELREIEARTRLKSPSDFRKFKTASDLLGEATAIERLLERAAPKLPKTAADYLRDAATAVRLDRPAAPGRKPPDPSGPPQGTRTGRKAGTKQAVKKSAKRKAAPKGPGPRKR